MARTAYDITSVHRLLEIHDDGDKLAEINEDLAKLIREISSVQAGGGKGVGALTITITAQAHQKGVDVAVTHAMKMPKKAPSKSRYFLSEDGDVLSTRNPNQREMFGGRSMTPGGVTVAG